MCGCAGDLCSSAANYKDWMDPATDPPDQTRELNLLSEDGEEGHGSGRTVGVISLRLTNTNNKVHLGTQWTYDDSTNSSRDLGPDANKHGHGNARQRQRSATATFTSSGPDHERATHKLADQDSARRKAAQQRRMARHAPPRPWCWC